MIDKGRAGIERPGTVSRLGFRLEQLIYKLFVHQGFETRLHDGGDLGYDLIVETGHATAVVEVKLYSSVSPGLRNILQALERLEQGRVASEATFGILATNSRLTPEQRSQLERFPSLRVYDFDVLAALISSAPQLALELEDINREALVFRGEALPEPEPVDIDPLREELGGDDVQPLAAPDGPEPTSSEPSPPGAQLCLNIRNVSKSAAKNFEKACEAAIRWLFKDELVAFDDQHGSHTGHNIFDLVARIASKEDFWQALITDFRARYVVFEFKNYGKQITQREIYTTEKYLYPMAMRGAAIIVSRNGANEGAHKAMRGALRESGKLILSLSVDELCDMLHARDAGSDHLVTLVDKLDAMLMGLER